MTPALKKPLAGNNSKRGQVFKLSNACGVAKFKDLTPFFSGEELIPRVVEIYRRIDATYCEAAKRVEFSCKGCDGTKCCTVDLTISTLVEMSYLRQGFNTLPQQKQSDILARCRQIIRARDISPDSKFYRNSVCPLNSDGSCVLYEYRPMICRFHGVPYFFTGPRGSAEHGEGCPKFEEQSCGLDLNLKIDRTPFYREMALMELEAVRARGQRTEKRTVAQALWEWGSGL